MTKFPVYVCPYLRSDSEAFAKAIVRYQKNRRRSLSSTHCAVCGGKVQFGPQQPGEEKRVVAFQAQTMLERLEKSAMGSEWIGHTEAPDFDAARQLGTSSLS